MKYPQSLRWFLILTILAGTVTGMSAPAWAPDPGHRDAHAVPSCPGLISGNLPLIESSRLRMSFKAPAAAADRFVSFAAMSALAYVGAAPKCQRPSLDRGTQEILSTVLAAKGWRAVTGEFMPTCEDATGLFYRAWVHGADNPSRKTIAIAFRGTDDRRDWKSNLRAILRPSEDQYGGARSAARKLVEEMTKAHEGQSITFVATGHSLGGGLAQHVLYDQPRRFRQAVGFNSSPISGKGDVSKRDRKEACTCREDLNAEARIYRVYESNEMLDIVGKGLRNRTTPTPLDRHEHEIAFDFDTGNPIRQHSMVALAMRLTKMAGREKGQGLVVRGNGTEVLKWYRGVDTCTARFERGQRAACRGEGFDLWEKLFGSDCPS
jgi:pimeloyl-ACP methyl ester carboxylesterase